MNAFLFLMSVTVIGLISAALIVEHKYEDGVVGRAALGVMSITCLIIVLTSISEDRYSPHAETTTLTVSVAIFLCRHYYRFLMYTRFGLYLWRGSQGSEASQKEPICQPTKNTLQ